MYNFTMLRPRPIARRLRNALKWTSIALVSVFLAAFLIIQTAQLLYVHRASQLLKDFQAIRINQSTWADAQGFMHRWHRWGNTDGPCSAKDCGYAVVVPSPTLPLVTYMNERWQRGFARFHIPQLVEQMGGKTGWIDVSIIVEDGKIARDSIGIVLDVPAPFFSRNEFVGYGLLVDYKVLSSLNENAKLGTLVLGSRDELVAHPDYVAGRPGLCDICESAEITATPQLAHSEAVRLTSFDLMCLTSLRNCHDPSDILPAARPWHLYDHQADIPQTNPPRPCGIAPRALGRDALWVLEVVPIHQEPYMEPDGNAESVKTTVRIKNVLKGDVPQANKSSLEIIPLTSSYDSGDQAEPLVLNHPYLLFMNDLEDVETSQPTYLHWCNILSDTPSNIQSVNQGIQQSRPLRRSEVFTAWHRPGF